MHLTTQLGEVELGTAVATDRSDDRTKQMRLKVVPGLQRRTIEATSCTASAQVD